MAIWPCALLQSCQVLSQVNKSRWNQSTISWADDSKIFGLSSFSWKLSSISLISSSGISPDINFLQTICHPLEQHNWTGIVRKSSTCYCTINTSYSNPSRNHKYNINYKKFASVFTGNSGTACPQDFQFLSSASHIVIQMSCLNCLLIFLWNISLFMRLISQMLSVKVCFAFLFCSL